MAQAFWSWGCEIASEKVERPQFSSRKGERLDITYHNGPPWKGTISKYTEMFRINRRCCLACPVALAYQYPPLRPITMRRRLRFCDPGMADRDINADVRFHFWTAIDGSVMVVLTWSRHFGSGRMHLGNGHDRDKIRVINPTGQKFSPFHEGMEHGYIPNQKVLAQTNDIFPKRQTDMEQAGCDW